MTYALSTVLALGGIVLIIVAIIGGSITGHFNVPVVRNFARLALAVAGVALLVLAIANNSTTSDARASSAGSNGGTSSSTGASPAAGANGAVPFPTGSSTPTSLISGIVKVTSPTGVTEISVATGLLVKGWAVNLGNDSIWLLDFDPLRRVDAYFQVNEQPIPVVEGDWQFIDAPIGNSSDAKGKNYYVKVLRANESCAKALRDGKKGDNGDVTFDSLPSGCAVVATLGVVKKD